VVRVEGIAEPCLVRKSDGGFLYATTDLAAIRRRVQKFGADRVIYCVDARQTLHFRLVFGAAKKAGYARKPGSDRDARLEHAAFGSVLGDDGRPFKTRSGENVKLTDLIDQGIQTAEVEVAKRYPDLPTDQRRSMAQVIGIAAIKYADLSNDRIKDYVFNMERMVAAEGNTGPYLLYALVRVKSIFRKAAAERGLTPERWKTAAIRLEAAAEKTLALALLRYPGTVRAVGETLEPHRLCQYLFELAGAYGGFYEACPVLTAPDEPTRLSRLRLCDLTARVLTDGLTDLGIPTLERM
jgi:arginyl-tRNA synthetase